MRRDIREQVLSSFIFLCYLLVLLAFITWSPSVEWFIK